MKFSKNNTIFYLIGNGYLGSSIKNLLVKNNYDVLIAEKNRWLTKEFFDRLGRNVVILFFAAPSTPKQSNNLARAYINIENYLDQFIQKSNYKIIYANSSLINFKQNQLTNFDKIFIRLNKKFLKKDSNFYNLLIPYIYDKKMKKNSLYTKIKKYKEKFILKNPENNLGILDKKLWRVFTFEKIKNILCDESEKIIKYPERIIHLKTFKKLITKDII